MCPSRMSGSLSSFGAAPLRTRWQSHVVSRRCAKIVFLGARAPGVSLAPAKPGTSAQACLSVIENLIRRLEAVMQRLVAFCHVSQWCMQSHGSLAVPVCERIQDGPVARCRPFVPRSAMLSALRRLRIGCAIFLAASPMFGRCPKTDTCFARRSLFWRSFVEEVRTTAHQGLNSLLTKADERPLRASVARQENKPRGGPRPG